MKREVLLCAINLSVFIGLLGSRESISDIYELSSSSLLMVIELPIFEDFIRLRGSGIFHNWLFMFTIMTLPLLTPEKDIINWRVPILWEIVSFKRNTVCQNSDAQSLVSQHVLFMATWQANSNKPTALQSIIKKWVRGPRIVNYFITLSSLSVCGHRAHLTPPFIILSLDTSWNNISFGAWPDDNGVELLEWIRHLIRRITDELRVRQYPEEGEEESWTRCAIGLKVLWVRR